MISVDQIEARQEVKEEEADPTKRTILQTSRLFVRNLAFSCTEEELHELFSSVGPLSRVSIYCFPSPFQDAKLA